MAFYLVRGIEGRSCMRLCSLVEAPMISVLIVDNDLVMRDFLRKLLERHRDIRVIGEAHNGEEGVAQAKRLDPTAVIMDFDLPTMSGIEATTLIKLQRPDKTIVGLKAGVPGNAEYAMIDAGAAAVLNKEELVSVLYPIILQEVKKQSASVSATVSL
jgi:DNA-binding NarL/FixJ family response regulator